MRSCPNEDEDRNSIESDALCFSLSNIRRSKVEIERDADFLKKFQTFPQYIRVSPLDERVAFLFRLS